MYMLQCRSLRELDHASMTELQDLGVEAAWRLQQWDDLDAMASPPRNHQPKPSAAHSLVDPFVVHTGKLLTTIVKRDNENFQTIVHEARMNVGTRKYYLHGSILFLDSTIYCV